LASKSTLDAGTSATGIGKSGLMESFLDGAVTPPRRMNNNSSDLFGIESAAQFATLSQDRTPNKTDLNPSKSIESSPFALPQIKMNRDSMLKGFNNISIVTQKLRNGEKRHNSVSKVEAKEQKVELKEKIRSASRRGKKDEGPKMSPKVLETWINETLNEADHLDIPGVALKLSTRIR